MSEAWVPGEYGITKRIEDPHAGEGDCWRVKTWRPDGYAEYSSRGLVHRIAWTRANGREIPDGYEVHHECLTRNCVNPRHLRLLTHEAHHALHHLPTPDTPPEGACRHGHSWAIYAKLTTQGRWVCIECGRDAVRRHDAKRRPKRWQALTTP